MIWICEIFTWNFRFILRGIVIFFFFSCLLHYNWLCGFHSISLSPYCIMTLPAIRLEFLNFPKIFLCLVLLFTIMTYLILLDVIFLLCHALPCVALSFLIQRLPILGARDNDYCNTKNHHHSLFQNLSNAPSLFWTLPTLFLTLPFFF